VHLPVPAVLNEWFASLTGKTPNVDRLAAEQDAAARALRTIPRAA
jgi:hypothetical protein